MKLWSNGEVSQGGSTFNPERRLLAAVMQRAITDYISGDGELQESARQWLFGLDDPGESFGFAYICEALDFHMEEMRKAIQLQYEAHIRNSKKAAKPAVEVVENAEAKIGELNRVDIPASVSGGIAPQQHGVAA